jgi:hypothetical protein
VGKFAAVRVCHESAADGLLAENSVAMRRIHCSCEKCGHDWSHAVASLPPSVQELGGCKHGSWEASHVKGDLSRKE